MSDRSLTPNQRNPLPWSNIGQIQYDPVFLDMQRFQQDLSPGTSSPRPVLGTDGSAFEAELGRYKVGLMIGQPVHLQTGKPFLLPSVARAFRSVAEALGDGRENTGYREPAGDPAFRAAITEYVIGKTGGGTDLPPVATLQTVGGTNAVRRALEFVQAKVPGFNSVMHAPRDRWVGHDGIARALGIHIANYPILNPETASLEGDRMLSVFGQIPDRSLVCLSFENPAGLIPHAELTRALQELFLRKGHIALFDIAYHGLMTGVREDTENVRSFMRAGVPTLVAYSAGKAFTLTGARVGALMVAANDEAHLSQIQDFAGHELNRPDFTHASVLGAHVVRHVLTNEDLRTAHNNELIGLRVALAERGNYFLDNLRECGLPEQFALPEQSRGLFRPLPWLGPNRVAASNALGIYPLDGRVTIMAPEPWLHYAARGFAKVAREVQEDQVPRGGTPLTDGRLPRPPAPGSGAGPLGLGGC